jgi:hypothetical protein
MPQRTPSNNLICRAGLRPSPTVQLTHIQRSNLQRDAIAFANRASRPLSLGGPRGAIHASDYVKIKRANTLGVASTGPFPPSAIILTLQQEVGDC